MRLVIDTNMIISSLISNSTRRHILMDSNIEFISPEYTFMKDIDPDDASFLALAMKTKVDGIWSEDKGFKQQNHVKIYNTKELLEII
jgi:predicted nucleic acid-binding protein